MDQSPHVVLLTGPGVGHLTPLVVFAKHLSARHCHFCATLVIPSVGPPPEAQKLILDGLPESIKYILLPPVEIPDGLDVESQIRLTISFSLPSIRETLTKLNAMYRLVAMVMDPFCLDAFDLAGEFGVPWYLFYTGSAMTLLFCFHLPKLDQTVKCEYRDLSDPVKLPGCIPLHGRDFMVPVHDRSSEGYKWLLETSRRFTSTEGIILNSFVDMEEGAIKAAQEKQLGYPPVYPIGPLIQSDSGSGSSERARCLKWLDKQPTGSVLFIAFGSGGTLSHAQLTALAFGLEMSGQKFLWVVRCPNDESPNAAYLGIKSPTNPSKFLPDGFLDRTRDRGLVVASWAPQTEVLRHRATGVFCSHCGWNSTLEAVAHGVPLLTWPLHAEQRMNAALLVEDLGVALRPRAGSDGLVRRLEVAEAVKNLMDGEEAAEVRRRMNGLRDAAVKVMSEDGSSTKSLSELTSKWDNQ